MGAIAEPRHMRRVGCAPLPADRLERDQQTAPQHIALAWHSDFGGEEMAEASERQAALPGSVGTADGDRTDEPLARRSGSPIGHIDQPERLHAYKRLSHHPSE